MEAATVKGMGWKILKLGLESGNGLITWNLHWFISASFCLTWTLSRLLQCLGTQMYNWSSGPEFVLSMILVTFEWPHTAFNTPFSLLLHVSSSISLLLFLPWVLAFWVVFTACLWSHYHSYFKILLCVPNVCVCVRICEDGHVRTVMLCGGQRTTIGGLVFVFPLFTHSLLLFTAVYSRLVGWVILLPLSSSSPQEYWNYKYVPLHPTLFGF